MHTMKITCDNIFIFLLALFTTVKSYPLKGENLDNKVEFNDEKRYPNGTVIGKYTYKDKEGNPIHVKYYADDSSYGVELKSVKIFDGNSEITHDKLPKLENFMTTLDTFKPFKTVSAVNTIFDKNLNRNKSCNPFDVFNSYSNNIDHYKNTNKENDKYEVFLENDLKPSEKYNKENVKVYLDKNKRKTRNAFYHYNPSASCERL